MQTGWVSIVLHVSQTLNITCGESFKMCFYVAWFYENQALMVSTSNWVRKMASVTAQMSITEMDGFIFDRNIEERYF